MQDSTQLYIPFKALSFTIVTKVKTYEAICIFKSQILIVIRLDNIGKPTIYNMCLDIYSFGRLF